MERLGGCVAGGGARSGYFAEALLVVPREKTRISINPRDAARQKTAATVSSWSDRLLLSTSAVSFQR